MRVTPNPAHLVSAALALALAAPAAALAQVPGERAPDVAQATPRARPLSLRADLGGTEPGTSRQAFEGVLAYRGDAPWELQAGYSYGDQVFYSSSRGFLTAYRFFNDGLSYVKADGSLRKYQYPTDPTVQQPNPDSNAYDWVWRGELEASHLFTRALRGTVQYQLFPASFFHDPSSWTWNHKLSAEVEVRPIPQLRLAARAAALRDPDPRATEIKGRAIPGTATLAARTDVVYRTTSLVGGSAAVELGRVGAKLEYLPNRDLDNSYAWSLLSTLDLRILAWLDLRLQQVHDRYASVSNFPGRSGEIWMGAAGFLVSEGVRLRAGYRYVSTPSRSGGTAIVGAEWRTPLP